MNATAARDAPAPVDPPHRANGSALGPYASTGADRIIPAMTSIWHGRRAFWTLHVGGWATFAVAMALSRIGRFPIDYMFVSKSLLALSGAILSLGLAWLYRRTLTTDAPIVKQIAVAVVASYLVALPWTAIDNYLDIPVRRALMHQVIPPSQISPFLGSLYNAFILLAWSMLYLSVKSVLALGAARERAIRAEALANEARLQALRFQIQPHLLFNSLNALSTLIVEQRTDEASRMVSRISDFLRHTLIAEPTQEVTLEEELAFVDKYLDIEQVRFGDRLRLVRDVAGDTLRCRVPAFVLQPLVENAVRHAVEPSATGGSITITSRRNGDGMLVLEVRDSGPGASASQSAPREGFGGIGIANTRARLEQLFGARQSLELRRVDGQHVVELRLPATV